MYRMSDKAPYRRCIYFCRCICIVWLGITSRNLATLHGNRLDRSLRVNTESRAHTLLLVRYGTLMVEDTNKGSIEEHLVSKVRLLSQVIPAFHERHEKPSSPKATTRVSVGDTSFHFRPQNVSFCSHWTIIARTVSCVTFPVSIALSPRKFVRQRP